ncbi:MAG: ABC transporter ATP-binding protein [Corynebacterium flavescens]|nr:ABC transporter ATP-binding protein [Corynebacterium flavescens]MDN6431143.1 ABC transporter ATP-binding protein [Corynebacterium flavescens]MDN6476033.1 ABC transporter ATP-binding protein [Corynebacterium flavescens]MDN6602196.1 ABC transporter ATP-binding protein [Corynebacterium flavescens]MDN6822948.1 ABC transporter ATP-binding protein [Corynebacterium flavescens]
MRAQNLGVSYQGHEVIKGLDLDIPAGAITTLIGPNGCGKSTLLQALAALLPHSGSVELGGQDFASLKRPARARQLAMLPQQPTAPEAVTVEELVSRGRHPHQSWMRRWSAQDAEEVERALVLCDVAKLAQRPLGSLSGGQKQRVWIAMTLAQDTPTVFLDEPTTYLDLSHSIDVLRLVAQLRTDQGKTIVMVLHDLNLAIRHSDFLVVMSPTGEIYAQGTPAEIITADLLREIFDLEALVVTDPVTGGPMVVPAL